MITVMVVTVFCLRLLRAKREIRQCNRMSTGAIDHFLGTEGAHFHKGPEGCRTSHVCAMLDSAMLRVRRARARDRDGMAVLWRGDPVQTSFKLTIE
jgi:hypothetical protein